MGAETELKEESTGLRHQATDCSEQPKKESLLKKIKHWVAHYKFGSSADAESERFRNDFTKHQFTRFPTIAKKNGSPPYAKF